MPEHARISLAFMGSFENAVPQRFKGLLRGDQKTPNPGYLSVDVVKGNRAIFLALFMATVRIL